MQLAGMLFPVWLTKKQRAGEVPLWRIMAMRWTSLGGTSIVIALTRSARNLLSSIDFLGPESSQYGVTVCAGQQAGANLPGIGVGAVHAADQPSIHHIGRQRGEVDAHEKARCVVRSSRECAARPSASSGCSEPRASPLLPAGVRSHATRLRCSGAAPLLGRVRVRRIGAG
jgi:hypothetical protein